MRLKSYALAVAFVLALSAPAVLAGPGGRIVEGEDAQKHVETLVEKVRWQRSLDDALALAKKEGKLVFWMHVKGDLDGAT